MARKKRKYTRRKAQPEAPKPAHVFEVEVMVSQTKRFYIAANNEEEARIKAQDNFDYLDAHDEDFEQREVTSSHEVASNVNY